MGEASLGYDARMEPTPPPDRSGFRRLVVLLAVVVLVAGVSVVLRTRSPQESARKSSAIAEPDTGESAVQRALRLAGIDSTKKNAWVDEVPGADIRGWTPARREVFLRFVNAERCTCGCGFTLGACRQYDSSCEVSLPRVKRLYDSVAAGLLTDASGVRARPGTR